MTGNKKFQAEAERKIKAKYIGKTADKNYIYLEYEYKGEKYEVYIHKTKGGEPLRWQHANAQARIDAQIELEEKTKKSNFVGESAQEGLDRFFEYLETGVWRE